VCSLGLLKALTSAISPRRSLWLKPFDQLEAILDLQSTFHCALNVFTSGVVSLNPDPDTPLLDLNTFLADLSEDADAKDRTRLSTSASFPVKEPGVQSPTVREFQRSVISARTSFGVPPQSRTSAIICRACFHLARPDAANAQLTCPCDDRHRQSRTRWPKLSLSNSPPPGSGEPGVHSTIWVH